MKEKHNIPYVILEINNIKRKNKIIYAVYSIHGRKRSMR